MSTRNSVRSPLGGKGFVGGGLNATDNPLVVPAEDMVECRNILIGSRNARRKRGGTQKYNTDGDDATASYPTNPSNGGGLSNPIYGAIEWWRYDSGTGAIRSDLVVAQGTKLWSIANRTAAAVNKTGALVFTLNSRVQFQPFENGSGPQLYVVSSNTAFGFNRWDGIAANNFVAGTPPPDGVPTTLSVHNGRLWASGVDGFPYRLYYSNANDGDDWTTVGAAGSLDFDAIGDPKGIVGHISFQGRLYVFMRDAIYEVTGNTPSTFVVTVVARGVGCLNQSTIVPVGNDVVFASERGISTLRSTDKAMESEFGYLSRNISRIWNEQLDKNRYDTYNAVYDHEESLYLITVPSLGANKNDTILALNVETGGWSVWETEDCRCLCQVRVSAIRRVFAGLENGRLCLLNDSTRLDITSNYNAIFKTGLFTPGDGYDQEHVFRSITIRASTNTNTTLVVSWDIDGRSFGSKSVALQNSADTLGTSFVLGQSTLSRGNYVPITIPIAGKGRGIQISVNAGANADVEIFGFIVESFPADYNYRT